MNFPGAFAGSELLERHLGTTDATGMARAIQRLEKQSGNTRERCVISSEALTACGLNFESAGCLAGDLTKLHEGCDDRRTAG